MYFEYYLMGIILLPGLLLAIYAQTKVTTTYNKYNSVFSNSEVTASQLIKRLLSSCDMMHIRVNSINGHLSDHYDPRSEEINLSHDVYSSTSVSALGIACHEFGHALQKKEKYFFYEVRRILVPITNFASKLLWPLVIIGLIFNLGVEGGGTIGNIFLYSGVIFFGASVLFNLVTLPVEFDASKKALKILASTNTLTSEELSQTKEVLDAAALTYVAALIVSVLNLLRFLLVVLSNRNRN